MFKPDACSNCGSDRAIGAHHDDYARPLDVEWLCQRCHGLRHRGPTTSPTRPDEQTLIRLVLAKQSIVAVADERGVSRQTVYAWLRKYDIRFDRVVLYDPESAA
jgi:transposase-like protein